MLAWVPNTVICGGVRISANARGAEQPDFVSEELLGEVYELKRVYAAGGDESAIKSG